MKLSLIATLFHKKEFLEVLEYLESNKHVIPSLDKDQFTKVLYYKGLCYANLKKYENALEFLDACIKSNLDSSYLYQCRMLKGYMYTITNRLRLAEVEFLSLLNEGYQSARIYAAAAHVKYQLKKVSAAVRYLQKALHIDPDNINALNSMSYILADNNIKLSFALEYIGRVLHLEPQNAAYLDTYGYVLIKLRRFPEAKRVLKYALTISDHPEIKKHYDIAQAQKQEL